MPISKAKIGAFVVSSVSRQTALRVAICSTNFGECHPVISCVVGMGTVSKEAGFRRDSKSSQRTNPADLVVSTISIVQAHAYGELGRKPPTPVVVDRGFARS